MGKCLDNTDKNTRRKFIFTKEKTTQNEITMPCKNYSYPLTFFTICQVTTTNKFSVFICQTNKKKVLGLWLN